VSPEKAIFVAANEFQEKAQKTGTGNCAEKCAATVTGFSFLI